MVWWLDQREEKEMIRESEEIDVSTDILTDILASVMGFLLLFDTTIVEHRGPYTTIYSAHRFHHHDQDCDS